MDLPKQFDNITQRVIDDLRVTLRQGGKVSVAAASFSIYAFEALRKELSEIDLIVIDESHNFRNGGKVTTDEEDESPRENRYLRLMNKQVKAKRKELDKPKQDLNTLL